MTFLNFIIPPLVGGIIALSTNWLAIKMLFRPHRAKYIFGFRIPFTPGLIPKERVRLIQKLAETASTHLLTPEVLQAGLADPTRWPLPDMTIGEALAALGMKEPPIDTHLKTVADKLLPKAIAAINALEESALDTKLAELTYKVIDENINPLAGLFISKEKIYTSIKQNVTQYLSDPENLEPIREQLHNAIDALMSDAATQDALSEKLYAFNIREGLGAFLEKEKHAVTHVLSIVAAYIANNMPIQSMIEDKLAAFDVAEAEELILTVAGRELRLIIWLGGFLGFGIGLFLVFFG